MKNSIRNKAIVCLVGILLAGATGLVVVRLEGTSGTQKSPNFSIKRVRGKSNIVEVLILGSGPAGGSAAIYAARAGMYTVVVEGEQPGGLLTQTTEVENWPGEISILGPVIPEKLKNQAEHLGAHYIADTVTSINFSHYPYQVTLASGTVLHALTIIAATGATPRQLGVVGEQEYQGRGKSSCAICDGPFFKGQKVVVVGGGDSAVEEATLLSSYAQEVIVLVRKDRMRAAARMQQRLAGYSNITVHYNQSVRKIVGDGKQVTGIYVYDSEKKQEKYMPIDGVFLAIGHDPQTDLFKSAVVLDDQGYIEVESRSQRTSVPGVFAAGDVEDPVYRQAGVAAGSGIRAALDAVEFLREIGLNEQTRKQFQNSFLALPDQQKK